MCIRDRAYAIIQCVWPVSGLGSRVVRPLPYASTQRRSERPTPARPRDAGPWTPGRARARKTRRRRGWDTSEEK
eukprot:2995313-Prymnesium_polylepis.1